MMIHARKMGESFGIAIAESLYFNVPIAASNMGKDKNHTILLKNSGLIYSNEIELIDLYKKIKTFRQSGLESGGEYSYENLTFKLLRRNGYIEKLLKLKTDILNKKLSITQ